MGRRGGTSQNTTWHRTAETFSATIRKELALYGSVVKTAGIKMN